jgi:hypothetical protein
VSHEISRCIQFAPNFSELFKPEIAAPANPPIISSGSPLPVPVYTPRPPQSATLNALVSKFAFRF